MTRLDRDRSMLLLSGSACKADWMKCRRDVVVWSSTSTRRKESSMNSRMASNRVSPRSQLSLKSSVPFNSKTYCALPPRMLLRKSSLAWSLPRVDSASLPKFNRVTCLSAERSVRAQQVRPPDRFLTLMVKSRTQPLLLNLAEQVLPLLSLALFPELVFNLTTETLLTLSPTTCAQPSTALCARLTHPAALDLIVPLELTRLTTLVGLLATWTSISLRWGQQQGNLVRICVRTPQR